MADETYHVIEHDGGWAYTVDGVFSETFPTHAAAMEAARLVAQRQTVGGEAEGIAYQDPQGAWHEETAEGDDRPNTAVVDGA